MKNIVLNLSMILLLLTLPLVHFAQTPNLGRVGSFALFTSAGAFSNTGPSAISGDIGTHVGALSGFPPGTVSGSIHVADSVTALAATNLGTAYGYLSTLPCDSTLPASLGNGQILTPKVYCITTLATLSGNLILNAMGNPNAVFVIKINGALSTGISSKVLLTNSAHQNNVYWQINGAFTLADSSQFKGTLLANGALNLMQKANVVGRALTTAGAISITITSNSLPVNLTTFTAQCNKSNIDFLWSTASEKNNRFFTLESSANQDVWTSIATIKGAGTSNKVNSYAYLYQNNLPENTYFRLKQTDFDGTFAYSNALVACANDAEKITVTIYPNPASGLINLSYPIGLNQSASVTVYDKLGAKVYQSDELPSNINLSAQPNGIYFLHINTNNQIIVEKIMIKHN
jgi:hypothetical protein